MKSPNRTLSFIVSIVFFLAYAWLFVFMDRFRSGVPQSFLLFWAPVLLIFAAVAFQIVRLGKGLAEESLVVFELVLVGFFFHVVHLVLADGTFFLQDDAYKMMQSTEYIQKGNRFFTAGPEYGRYPLSQFFMLSLHDMSGLRLYDVAYYVPSIVSALGTVFLYLLARTVYRDRQVALFCYLGFSFFWFFSLTHNGFHPEFLAYVFLLACLFVFFRNTSLRLSSAAHLSLAALFLGATIPANITTSGFLAMMVAVALVAMWLSHVIGSRGSSQPVGSVPLLFFTTLALVAFLAYSLYVATPYFESVTLTVSEIRPPTYAPAAEVAAFGAQVAASSFRQHVAGDGFILFSLLFGAVMTFEVLARRRCPAHYFDVFLVSWAGVGLVLYVVWGLAPIGVRFFYHLGGRVLNFTYPFLLVGVAHAVGHAPTFWRRAALALVFMGFAVVSVSSLQFIPDNLVGVAAQPLEKGDNGQEWAALDWFATQFGPKRADATTTVTNQYVAHFFRYRFGGYPQTRLEFWEKDLSGLKDRRMNWIVMKPADPVFETYSDRQQLLRKRLDAETMRRISETPLLAQSYDNGEWVIYRVVR